MASHGLPMYMTGYPTTSYNQIRKKRELKLNPYLEAVGIARIMEISLEPTLSREQQKPYRYHYTVSCEFPTFPVITLKNIRDRHPAPRESMPVWAGAVYSYRQPTSDRKDNIKISNHQILHKEAVPLCVNLHKKVTKVTKVTGNSTPYYPSPQLLIIYNYIRVYIIYIYSGFSLW